MMAENDSPAEGNSRANEVSEDRKMTQRVGEGETKSYGGLLSAATVVLSLPTLAAAIWLLYIRDYDCEKLLKLPKIQTEIGVGLIFVFLISNTVALLRSRFPVAGLFIVMVPLMVMAIMGFALVGALKMESRKLVATPMWFKQKVRDSEHWQNIKSCIYSTGTCNDLASRSANLKAFDFSVKKLSFIEFGCCKPPSACEMEYVNATFWIKGREMMDRNQQRDKDCDAWQNDPNLLCYDCESCRSGFVRTIEGKWRALGVFLISMASLLVIPHTLLFAAVMWERYKG